MTPRALMRALALGALAAASLAGPLAGRAAAVSAAAPAGGVKVTTVPAVAGVGLELDGVRTRTNAAGIATFPTAERRNAGLRLKVLDEVVENPKGVRSTLERVYGVGPDVALAFGTERQVDFKFETGDGTRVEPDRLQRLAIRSSVGDVVRAVPLDHPIWLRASRVVSTQNGPQERTVQWSVEKVLVDGSNVVNRAELRFEPSTRQHITVRLLFFTARILVKDAFFGFSHKGRLDIIRPDGTKMSRPVPSNGEVVLADMPRGDYQFTVAGSGVRLQRPLVLSRDQYLELELLSWLDLATVVIVGLLFCTIPLLVGRRRRRAGRGEVVVGKQPEAPSAPVEEPVLVSRHAALHNRRRFGATLGLALGLAMLLISATLPAAAAAGSASPISPDDPPVLAHYYIWFNATSWSRAKRDTPSAGRYSSDQVSVMRKHAREAKAAGIDGLIVSWKSTEVLDPRLENLMKVAAEEGLKLAITYQGLDFNRDPLPAARVGQDLDLFIERYADDPVFALFGKPLVIWSGTWAYSPEEIASVTLPRRNRLLILASEKNVDGIRRLDGLVDGDLYYWSSVNPATYPNYPSKLIDMAVEVHRRNGLWIAPVAPGFDARQVGGASLVERENGAVLRRQWAGAMASSPDAIGLISWNEFSENTYIEPSVRFGNHYLRALADLTGSPPPAAVDFDSSGPSGRVTRGNEIALRLGLVGALGGIMLGASVVAIRRNRGGKYLRRVW